MRKKKQKEEKLQNREPKEKKSKKNIFGLIVMVFSRLGIRVVVYALVVVLFFYGINAAASFGYSLFISGAMADGEGEEVLVTIREDMTDLEIGQLLESKGLVKDASSFVVQAKLYTSSRIRIHPGTYILNTAQTQRQMIEAMCVEPETKEEESTVFYLGLDEEEETEETVVDITEETME